jgi:signal transduction histidine kinase
MAGKNSKTDQLRKVIRALRVLSDCNQAIIRATDELSLLNEICKIAIDPGGYRMALIAFAEHDAHKSIKIVTYAGFSGEYIEELKDLTWADSQPKKAVSGKVIRTGKPFIVRDIGSEPDFAPWRDAAFKQGYQSVMFFPLIIDNNVIGVFNIYASELDAFDAEEQKLLGELANDVAYGIMSLRTKIEKQKIQEQLFQAQKMEAMGQLAAGIGHDFNNMLTAIIGYSNILYDKLKDNEYLRYNVEQIINASEKASGLVQSLLTFGRKQAVNFTSLDINKTITILSDLLRKLLGEYVILKMELASGQLTIMGNITQIEQVLMNLAGNANDAMPYGGSLTISTGTMEINGQFIKEHGFGRHGRFASVTVTDTGFGIDEDVMKKIFEPFFTTKPVGKGTGLGLSVVYSIVKQHKGYIDVHSELGKGTTFNIYLPLTENMPGN